MNSEVRGWVFLIAVRDEASVRNLRCVHLGLIPGCTSLLKQLVILADFLDLNRVGGLGRLKAGLERLRFQASQ